MDTAPNASDNGGGKDVIIIGGGLVGSLAALHLGRRNYNVHVYEYRDDIRRSQLVPGRSINLALSARGRRALAEVGLEHVLLEHGIPMRGRMLHDRMGRRTCVPYDPVTNQCIYSVSRKHLNEVLLNEADKNDRIRMSFNQKLRAANLRTGDVELLNCETKQITHASAPLLIGCDGAFSALRAHFLKTHGFDFSQTYIEHGYIELCIPPMADANTDGAAYQMEPNYLHIWPRGQFMMIALPNQDRTWTVTLFMPFERFASITDAAGLLAFFDEHFADVVPLMGVERLVRDFFAVRPQHLVSIKCRPHHVADRALLLGDAAHAMVPFFGQGMNAGFEDCSLLGSIIDAGGWPEGQADFGHVLEEFSRQRCDNAHTICDLAMHNYVEMRDLVTRVSFRVRKWLDELLFRVWPQRWVPLYNAVSFSTMPYSECRRMRQWQDRMLCRAVAMAVTIAVGIVVAVVVGALANGQH